MHSLNYAVLPVYLKALLSIDLCIMQVPEVTAANEVLEVVDENEVEEMAEMDNGEVREGGAAP